ncbi:Gfo/Idh/MocA family oxidoreductase [bacterium]|nr:MAG: Gfo/Idh/MocA family oxidoreductase [bacterium]
MLAGKPVFIEKPIALSMEDAEAITAQAKARDVFVAVGHVVRFFPGYMEAAQGVRSGAVGDVAAVRLRRGGGMPGANGISPWYADHAKSGGVFIDLAIHDFDWLLWTCGPAVRVLARSVGAATGQGPDHGLATVTLASGAIAHVEATWMDPGPFRTAFEVAGSGGLIEYDSRQNASVRTATTAELPMGGEADPYARQWRAIRDALAVGAPAPAGPEAATSALRLAHAALTSARSGQPVELTTP